MFKKLLVSTIVATGLMACGDDDANSKPGVSTNQTFRVRLENISNQSSLATPFAPGVWALSSTNPLFASMAMSGGSGLENLAEDGDPSGLLMTVAAQAGVAQSGVFNTPVGAAMPGVTTPGAAYEFDIVATPQDGPLSIASMLVQSNDLFVGTSIPVDLFDANGNALPTRDLSAMLELWDAGTEQNQAPGAGPDQAPRQSAAGVGAAENVIRAFSASTRAMPSASAVVDVTVSQVASGFEITVANVSATGGALLTPIAPVFWAVHANNWTLFSEGGAATAGLEELAEDGSPAGLVGEHNSTMGVAAAGAQATTVERPMDAAGPASPGERFQFTVNPNATHPRLSFAAMVVQSNDSFLALPPAGVALLDAQGMMRDASAVEADIGRLLAIWDAGTEANQGVGVGSNQAPRQSAANTGAADPDATIRRALDSANDLSDASALLAFQVAAGTQAGSFDITLTNTSDMTAYPTPFTPVLWAAHNETTPLFTMGQPASSEIEHLAEDGDPSHWATALTTTSGVVSSGVSDTPIGAGAAGPLLPGESYMVTVTPDAAHRYFSFASMVVQSNDAFVSVSPGGVALLDAMGAARPMTRIAQELSDALIVLDAGTEANQVGGAGPDQPLRQMAANTGPQEGSGLVRSYDDPIWSYPNVEDMIRFEITPVN